MRRIDRIIVHCTATPEGRHVTVKQVDDWHRKNNHWRNGIGYHWLIYLDGSIHQGRTESMVGAHCVGYNKHSIGVCYVGGLDKDGKTAKDTRTPEQKRALACILKDLHGRYPHAKLCGHRELVCKRKQKDTGISCADCLSRYGDCKFATKKCPSFDCHEYDYIFTNNP